MQVILLLFTLFYLCFFSILIAFWKRRIPNISSMDALGDKCFNRLSVVIPIRNEKDKILDLLYDLNLQDLSRQNWEVIIVDDQSNDGSVQWIKEHADELDFTYRILSLKVPAKFNGSHKKLAIKQAVEVATGDIIMVTDGDCRVGNNWLSTVQSYFDQTDVVFISGPVTFYQEKSFFQHLQTIEFASLVGTGGSCLNAGFPNMCNGANLAFTKESFIEVDGYQGYMHIASGDDEFLMHKIAHCFPKKVHFLKDRRSIVKTSAHQTLKAFYHQRKRWASKWPHYRDVKIKFLAFYIYFFYLVILICGVMVVFNSFSFTVFISLLLLKVLVDFIFLKSVMNFLQKPISFLRFLTLEMIYPFYVVFFGIMTNFGKYEWKSRTIG